MTNYILASREFKSEYVDQIQEISPSYRLIQEKELTEQDWDHVEITLGWSKKWEEKLLQQNSALKWVQTISAGVDTLPLKKLARYHVQLSNGSGIHAQSISDHVLALLFMKNRGILAALKNQQEKIWSDQVDIVDIKDLRILIVGTGKIGQQLAKDLEFFGCAPIGINTNGRTIDHFKETYSLVELASQTQMADVIINILPLTDDTRHLYDKDFFDLMKPTASFINVGRGASVDTNALYEALKEKKFAFAAIDVFEEEPLPAASPLWDLDNLVITPHFSGYTPHFQKAFMPIFLTNLNSYSKTGKLTENAVNIRSGY